MNNADLKLVAMIIDQPGFKIIEDELHEKMAGLDHVSRVSGNAFDDGKLVGAVGSIESMLYLINELRGEIKDMRED